MSCWNSEKYVPEISTESILYLITYLYFLPQISVQLCSVISWSILCKMCNSVQWYEGPCISVILCYWGILDEGLREHTGFCPIISNSVKSKQCPETSRSELLVSQAVLDGIGLALIRRKAPTQTLACWIPSALSDLTRDRGSNLQFKLWPSDTLKYLLHPRINQMLVSWAQNTATIVSIGLRMCEAGPSISVR